eukprot:1149438-Pelagomonas_calceolata.AAC.2
MHKTGWEGSCARPAGSSTCSDPVLTGPHSCLAGKYAGWPGSRKTTQVCQDRMREEGPHAGKPGSGQGLS